MDADNDNGYPTLFFIRHGETDSNAARIRQGVQIDDYLNTEGVLQMERLAPAVRQLRLDMLVTSYLRRAEESAAVLEEKLPRPIPILHDFRLRERDFGSLTGKTQDYWDKALPDNREFERLQTYNYRPFGGESVDDVRQRAVSAILDLITNYPGKRIGIVTHNGIIRLMLFHFPDIPRIYRGLETEKDIANTDIYEWDISEGKIENLKSLLRQG